MSHDADIRRPNALSVGPHRGLFSDPGIIRIQGTGQGHVDVNLRLRRLGLRDLHRTPGRPGSSLRNGGKPRLKLENLLHTQRANPHLGLRVVRNRIEGLPSVQDDAMHPGTLRHLLAHQRDTVEEGEHGIQGVDPLLRGGCGMGRFTKELDEEAFDRKRDVISGAGARRVDDHGRIQPVEGPGPVKQDLAPPMFLRRASQEEDRSLAALKAAALLDGHRRASRYGPDHVMSTGMPNLGKSVVLAHQTNMGTPAAIPRHEGCLHAGHPPLHLESGLFQIISQSP